MSRLALTLALSRYDHTEDLTSGRIPVQGVDLNYLDLPVHDIFHRFVNFLDFDIAEMSMAKYVSMVSQDAPITALPVFLSRVARHSSIYVRRDGPVKTPADLAGRRVGVPEWAQTSAVYTRGLLAQHFGVDLRSVEWVQAGQDQAGRREKVALKLPEGLRLTVVTEKSCADMVVDGDIDAMLSAQPPQHYRRRHPNIARMFDNHFELERQYVAQTKILPIMHTVALRKAILDQHPWAVGNLMAAFEKAKNASVERALEPGVTRYPIPWCYEFADQMRSLWNGDYWPYGIEGNRETLEVFLQYAYEQGVCHRRLNVEELFPAQLHEQYRV